MGLPNSPFFVCALQSRQLYRNSQSLQTSTSFFVIFQYFLKAGVFIILPDDSAVSVPSVAV